MKSSEYVYRVTIICPESMVSDANQLAMVLGEGPADELTFRALEYQDDEGNRYAASSTVATGNFQVKATNAIDRPDWDGDRGSRVVNMTGAERAQGAIYIYGMSGTDGPAPGRLWAYIEPSPGNFRAAMGIAKLSRIDDVPPDAAQ
jgi:hypothetical protein